MIYVHPATGLRVRVLTVPKFITSVDVHGNNQQVEAGSEVVTEAGQPCRFISDGFEARVYTESGPVSVYRLEQS